MGGIWLGIRQSEKTRKYRQKSSTTVRVGGEKTTNLEHVFSKFRERIKSEMVSIKTHGDRTLFFDFLPFDIGKIMGYDVRIQLYTVPGQIKI